MCVYIVFGCDDEWNALFAFTEEAKEIEEEVDEVEVEGECAEYGEFLCLAIDFGAIGFHLLFDFLCVVGCKSHEDEYADGTDDEIHHGVMEEEVDHCGYDESDECHEEEGTYLSEVTARDGAVDGHGCESACCDEEGSGNGSRAVSEKNEREGGSIENGVACEETGCHGEREFVDGCGKREYEAEFGNN